MNSNSPVGLVSRQWGTVDWANVLCDRRIQNDRASRSASSQCACPFYSSPAGCFGETSHHPGLSAPLQPKFGYLQLLVFSKAKIAVEREEICAFDGHTVHTLSQQCLTAKWIAPQTVTVHGCTVRSPSTGCQVTSRPCDWLSRYSEWLILSRQPSYWVLQGLKPTLHYRYSVWMLLRQ